MPGVARKLEVQPAEVVSTAPQTPVRIAFLDGMRGIAISIVVFCHLCASGLVRPFDVWLTGSLFSDGRLGVGLFFVISGFIISSLILREKSDSPRAQLLGFYLRRSLKLIPPLFLLVGVTYLANRALGSTVCSTRDYVSALTFTKEFFFPAKTMVGCTKLVHLWSLSVEECFYLAWAPLLIFRQDWLVRPLTLIIIGLGVVASLFNQYFSAGASLLGQGVPPYIPLLPHLGELLIGAALADFHFHGKLRRLTTSRWSPQLFGLGMVALPVLHYSLYRTWIPQFFMASKPLFIGLFSASLILWVLTFPRSWLARCLEFGPLTFIGKRCYSIYLWQQFFFVFSNGAEAFPPWQALGWGFLGLAVVSTLSYQFIEEPCQNLGRKLSKQLRAKAVGAN